jgi:AcrR family transcriptional regulator
MGKAAFKAQARLRNARGKGDQLRAELIGAAINLLSRLGFDEPLSLRSVAKEAKVSAPSVYLHFKDRDQLLMAVLEQLFAEKIAVRNQAEQKAAEAGGGAWEQLLAGIIATVQFALERKGHYKVLFEGSVLGRMDDPKTVTFGRPIQKRTMELIQQVIHETPAARVSDDPERLSLLLWAGTHGVISLIINKPTHGWPEAAVLVEQMAVALIRP